MAAWRNLAVLAVALLGAGPAWTQTCDLKETSKPGDCFSLTLAMKLAGEWHVQRDDKALPVRLSATAGHQFVERILTLDANAQPVKTLRHYQTAQAQITTGATVSERTVRPERCLIVAQRFKDQLCCCCPDGPLTRAELETLEHLDSLALVGLLPGKATAVGQTWKLPTPVVQALCSFEGLVDHDLSGKLEAVTGDEARIVVAGTANGITLGAQVKLTVTATCTFDAKQGRITSLDWQQKDVREQGPASPATTLEATWKVTRFCLEEEPKEVSDVAVVKVHEGEEPPAPLLQLTHRDAAESYELCYDRDWHIVGQKDKHLILRLLERGDWVAQATITRWAPAPTGKHLSAEEFKEALADIPGWEPDEVREDGEIIADKGHWVYRVSALGEMDGLKVLQNFYLVAGTNGNQVVVAVTLKPALAEKLGSRDIKLLSGLIFGEVKEAAQQP